MGVCVGGWRYGVCVCVCVCTVCVCVGACIYGVCVCVLQCGPKRMKCSLKSALSANSYSDDHGMTDGNRSVFPEPFIPLSQTLAGLFYMDL